MHEPPDGGGLLLRGAGGGLAGGDSWCSSGLHTYRMAATGQRAVLDRLSGFTLYDPIIHGRLYCLL